jgi:hypothetical protein
MMYRPDNIFEAARVIRSELTRRLDATTAQEVDRRLACLLEEPDPLDKARAREIISILQENRATDERLKEFLNEHTSGTRLGQDSYSGLAGDPTLPSAPQYVCPIGNDYTWYQEGNDPIPLCPTHFVSLIPA